jgi:excisionase family DNA binding protein
MYKSVLTTSEAGEYCHVHLETVKNWIRRGELPAYRTLGGHYRIKRTDLDAFMAKHNIAVAEEQEPVRKKILIVDDDPLVLTTLFSVLHVHDPTYEIATAVDGYEAGEMVISFKPELIILDLIMPGLDGFKVCKRIKSSPRTRDTKVLAITAYPDDGNVERILQCGADACLIKPINAEELCTHVEKLLATSRSLKGVRNSFAQR